MAMIHDHAVFSSMYSEYIITVNGECAALLNYIIITQCHNHVHHNVTLLLLSWIREYFRFLCLSSQ